MSGVVYDEIGLVNRSFCLDPKNIGSRNNIHEVRFCLSKSKPMGCLVKIVFYWFVFLVELNIGLSDQTANLTDLSGIIKVE
jgi:hypothetical protein